MSTSDTVTLSDAYQATHIAAGAFVDELNATLEGDGVELPSLPEVALRVRNALAHPHPNIGRIASLVGSDPALAARLLKVANCSLFHRGSKKVNDLHTAIMRLGLKMVRNVVLSMAAQQVFIGYGTKAIRPMLEKLWRHSVLVAAVAHLVATRSKNVLPDEAFLGGLLHEVGGMYILMRAKDYPDLFEEQAAFQTVLQNMQSSIGAGIARSWEFPDDLVDAIEGHDSCNLICGSPASLTEIVAVANFLSERLEESQNDDEFIEDLPSFGSLELDRDTLLWILAASSNEVGFLQTALEA
jgi:HD-like signal output (HDOD) protein